MNQHRQTAEILVAVLDGLPATHSPTDERMRKVLTLSAAALREGHSPKSAQIRALRAVYGPQADL